MDTEKSTVPSPATTANTTKESNVQLTFRIGNKKDPASSYKKEIVLLDRALKDIPVFGIAYCCEIQHMKYGKGWVATSLKIIPPMKGTFIFELGREIVDRKTGNIKQDMTSTHDDGRIMIAPKTMVESGKPYDCEYVLSPQGNAYIVQKAQIATPLEVKIVSHEFPVSSVEVFIGGALQDDLQFDCMGGDEEMLEDKISILSRKAILDKEMVISNYEATCLDLMAKHHNRVYDRNRGNL